MALKRLRTSLPSSLMVASLDVLEVCDEASVDEVDGEACDSSVVRAVCALDMSFEDRAEETLVMNSPSGLLESALDGVSFSTSAR